MNIDALTIFVDVMRLGSFAAAARQRDVDPSSISRTVAALESGLGVRLFQRTTRTLTATEAGKRYFARVEPMLADLERAGEEARELSAAPAGHLRVTASVAFGQHCLVPLLAGLHAEYPDLTAELMLTDANLDLVAERVDVAIRLGPRLDVDMIATKLFDTTYRVVASPDYVSRHGAYADPQELAAADCLLFPFSGFRSAWRFRDAGGHVRAVPVRGSLTISSALSLRQCALDGLGPALLGDWLIDDDIASHNLIDLFPRHTAFATEPETAAWLLYPGRDYVPLKVRVLIDFLKDRLRR